MYRRDSHLTVIGRFGCCDRCCINRAKFCVSFDPDGDGDDSEFQPGDRPASLRRVSLQRASAKGALFIGAEMAEADLRHIDATDANFTGAWLTGVNLIGASTAGARFGSNSMEGLQVGLGGTQYSDFLESEELPEKDRTGPIYPDM